MDAFDAAWGESESSAQTPISSFDTAWSSIPETSPENNAKSFLENYWIGIKNTPSAALQIIKDIPSGASNLAHLPGDIYGVAKDAYGLAKEEITGEAATPSTTNYDRTLRTLKGVQNIAGQIAGFGVAGPAGGAAMNTLLDYANEGVGNLFGNETPVKSSDQKMAEFAQNMGTGTVLNMVAKPIAKGAEYLSEKATPISPEMQQVQALGITAGNIKKANKYRPTINGETPIEQSIQGAIKRGVFTGDTSPLSIEARNIAAQRLLNEQLHGEQGILKQADTAIQNQQVSPATIPPESLGWWQSLNDYVNQKNAPTSQALPKTPIEYNRAMKFIAENPDQAPALLDQLQRRQVVTDQIFDGTLSSLSKRKAALGKIAYQGTSDSRALDRAIYQDIKNTIEQRANEAVPGLGDAVKQVNTQLAEHYTLSPIIEAAKAKELAGQFKAQKPSTLTDVALSAGKGFIQGGLGGAIASGVGAPGVTVPVALGIAALKGGATALRNPTIMNGISNVFGTGAKVASAVPQLAMSSKSNSDLPKTRENKTAIDELFRNYDMKPQNMPEFESKVNDVAASLGANPADLMAVMKFETGGTLDSAEKNRAGSGATGLIQFMPETAKNLTGASSKEAATQIMASMTPTEQLDYVQKYLQPFKGKLNSLEDMYMAVLYPKAVGQDPNYALFKEGTKAYWQNRGLDLNQDGVITKAEAAQKVSDYA